jgi:DNA-binding transcriptional LysR family regulator
MRNKQRPLPSLDLIKGFEAAARNLSFTKAAEELFVTQSAISRQIKTLEEHLGVALFRRRNREVLLTDAGHVLYGSASKALRELEDATAKLGDSAGRALAVTTSISMASLWLVPRLPRFRKQHPGSDVRIFANTSIVDMARERIDVSIRFIEPKSAPDGAIPLTGKEWLFPVCAPALLEDRARPLRRLEDLSSHVLLHFDPSEGHWPWLGWSDWLRAMKAGGINPIGELTFSHYDQVLHAAVDGEGIALGRSTLVARYIENRLLAAPFEHARTAPFEYFIIVSPGSAGRPEVRSFVAWLEKEVTLEAKLRHTSGQR